jgi:hypothetical protein
MSINFSNAQGQAEKGNSFYKLKDGDNRFRLIGNIMPYYAYWLSGANNSRFSLECLAFNRDAERFDKRHQDLVPKYFPNAKAAWAYHILVVDLDDGNKIKLFPLKKKLFQQIREAAESLGDPTNLDNGWDCVVRRTKTGPLPINIDLSLQALKLKKSAVSPEIREAINAHPTIDALMPVLTPAQQEEIIKKHLDNGGFDEDLPDALKDTKMEEEVPF